jgi:hypothetical protein
MSRALTYAGIFLIAMATLMLEVLLTRITSVGAWYHLAFFVISLGMLGMTAGAVLVFVFAERFPADQVGARLAQSALGFALTAPLCVGFVMSIPLSPVTDLMSFLALFGAGAALSLPFVLAGTTLTLALTRAGLPAGIAYGVDLIGAASGCMVMLPILARIDAPSAALLASTIAALAATAFAFANRSGRLLPCASALVLVLLAAANAGATYPPFRPAWVKGVREVPEWFSYLGWNTYSRITVDQGEVKAPVFWAKGRNTPPEMLAPLEQRALLIDGAAGTVMTRLGAAERFAATHAYLDWDITAFAHHLRPSGPAAVIGVGGGRDVLEAARVGHRPVIGVEINDLIVSLHQARMAEFSGIARLPGVELVTDEARSFMARDTRHYSVLTMSLIDTWASTGAGAYSLSENGLYTREAWQTFIRRLTPDGIFTVSRWYLVNSPGETARMLALALETLWELGATAPLQHLVVLQTDNIATLLLARNPFSEADIDRVQAEAVRMGFNMILTPRKLPAHPVLRDLVRQRTREALWHWTARQPLDLTPPTDARPFFFSMLKPATWLVDRASVDQMDLSFLGNLQATQTLVYATLVSVLLTLLTVLAPFALRRRDFPTLARANVIAASSYFALIGLGFMYVEMGLLSQLNVFLGRPTLALAVLLAGIIFFTGLGSLLSGRVSFASERMARFYPWLPAALIVGSATALPHVMRAFEASGTWVRVLCSLSLMAPPALGMGLGFPLGLSLVERMEARAIQRAPSAGGPTLGPWLWGINGAFGVCASGLALGSSMAWGIGTTLALGACCYAVLPLLTRRLARD